MEKTKVLISGKNGFLMKNIIKDYNWEVSSLIHCGKHNDQELVLHFASPSDSEGFKETSRLVEANLLLTIAAVEESNRNKCKLVFASSMAVQEEKSEYSSLKEAAELYIKTYCKDYVILRIPRVYGKDRTKGLMKKIKDGIVDNYLDEVVQYIDIEDFKEFFKDSLGKNGIITYDKEFRKNTIKEIKDLYCE